MRSADAEQQGMSARLRVEITLRSIPFSVSQELLW